MTRLRRALITSVLAAAIAAITGATASAVTVGPAGPFTLTSNALQTFSIPSIGAVFTCLWTLNGQLLQTVFPLGNQLRNLGGITEATIECNEPVIITALVSTLTGAPGPWPIGVIPNTGVLNLPMPTGFLFTLLTVRVKVVFGAFRCLFTGTIGLLVKNFTPEAVVLLGGAFVATPVLGDTCPAGLVATKGAGVLTIAPPWTIGP